MSQPFTKARLWNASDYRFHKSLLRDETPEEHARCKQSVNRLLRPDDEETGWKCPACGEGNIDPETYDCYMLRSFVDTDEDGEQEQIWYKDRKNGCGHNDNPTVAKREGDHYVDEEGCEVVDPLMICDQGLMMVRKHRTRRL